MIDAYVKGWGERKLMDEEPNKYYLHLQFELDWLDWGRRTPQVLR